MNKTIINKINMLGGVENLNCNTCLNVAKQFVNSSKIDSIEYVPVLTKYNEHSDCYVDGYKINSKHYDIFISADVKHRGLSTYGIRMKDEIFNSIMHRLNSFVNEEFFEVNANKFKETCDYLSDVANIKIDLYSDIIMMVVDNSWHYEIPHEFSLKLIHDVDYLNKFITDIFETFINGVNNKVKFVA